MSRVVSLLSLLALAVVPSLARAQGPNDDFARGPRFLLAARTARRMPVDVSRTPVLSQRMSLDLEDTTLEEALAVVSSKAGLHLLYSKAVAPLDRIVRLRAEDISVAGALGELLIGADVDVLFSGGNQAALVRRSAVAQSGSITGSVRDAATSAPLGGVSVMVVGTRLAATTGADGQYAITAVPVGSYRLRARRLGYAPGDTSVVVQEGQPTAVDFSLRASAIELNPVVAIGYGEQEKHNLTSAVGLVDGGDLTKRPVPTVGEALQAVTPGLTVIDRAGRPGTDGTTIFIRGRGTIPLGSNTTNPLVLVDTDPRSVFAGVEPPAGRADSVHGDVDDRSRHTGGSPPMNLSPWRGVRAKPR